MTREERWLRGGAVVALSGCTALALARLRLGVDFTDEAWYVATAYRFVLGDKPYVDEVFLMQGAALFTWPFIGLFRWLHGGTGGLILFTRHLYFGFLVLVAAGIFGAIRRQLGVVGARLLAGTFLLFAPYGIPNLSYNTLGIGFFTLGLFAATRVAWASEPLPEARAARWWALAGALHTLAFIAHVALSIATAFFFLWILLPVAGRWRRAASYAGGGILVGISILLILRISPQALWDNYQLTRAMNLVFKNEPGLRKLLSVFSSILAFLPIRPSFLAAFALVWLGFRKWPRLTACAVGLLIYPLLYRASRSALPFLLQTALLGPVLLCYAEDRYPLWQWMRWIWVPSIVTGISVCYTSYNGLGSAVGGMMPAALATTACLYVVLAQKWAKGPSTRVPSALPGSLALIAWLGVLAYLSWVTVYMEPSPRLLTHRIDSGPFRGLFTTETKKRYWEKISSEVLSAAGAGKGRIVFYPHFPAGYLMTSRLPAAPTIWGCMGLATPFCQNYHRQFLESGNVAVYVRTLYFNEGRTDVFEREEATDTLVAQHYRPVTRNEAFEIYVK